MAHSIRNFVLLLSLVSIVSALVKPRDFITNGIYTATYSDNSIGYLPKLKTAPGHTAGNNLNLNYQGNTSYIDLYEKEGADVTHYSANDWAQYRTAFTTPEVNKMIETYTFPVRGLESTMSVTTEIKGTTTADSYISVLVQFQVPCESETEDIKATDIKPRFRFTFDVEVDGDDGPSNGFFHDTMGEILGTNGFHDEIQLLGDDHLVASASIFQSTLNPSSYKVYIQTRGRKTGFDRYDFASYLDSVEYDKNFYYQGHNPSKDITSTSEGDMDDSVAILYYDGSACLEEPGVPLLACGQPGLVEYEMKISALPTADTISTAVCEYCMLATDGDDDDSDGDGVNNDVDNCPDGAAGKRFCDQRQQDYDNDGYGNACDHCPFVWSDDDDGNSDSDGDGLGNVCDNCYMEPNPLQEDADNDTIGDVCDNCMDEFNTDQADEDDDDIGDVCDLCPGVTDSDNTDTDGDGFGDPCDKCKYKATEDNLDDDSDGVGNDCDNCPNDSNQFQEDGDNDKVGDVCDNCEFKYNPEQTDSDEDGFGDVCDNCIHYPNVEQYDSDDDGAGDACDNCPGVVNADQNNYDGDEFGDECDACPYIFSTSNEDNDFDGKADQCDNCPEMPNPDQSDVDGDSVGDRCDNCPNDINPYQRNSDNDQYGDACDACPRSRWEDDIIAVEGGNAYNIPMGELGCYLSDVVDQCTVEYCVRSGPTTPTKDPRVAQVLY